MKDILIAIVILIVLIFITPLVIWQYLNTKAKQTTNSKLSIYNKYRGVTYYLNQLGYARLLQSPQQFALGIDNQFKTNFNSVTNIYQKLKYSSIPLTEKEQQFVNEFYKPFIKQIKAQVPLKIRFSKFLNIYSTIHYFTQPKIN